VPLRGLLLRPEHDLCYPGIRPDTWLSAELVAPVREQLQLGEPSWEVGAASGAIDFAAAARTSPTSRADATRTIGLPATAVVMDNPRECRLRPEFMTLYPGVSAGQRRPLGNCSTAPPPPGCGLADHLARCFGTEC
jgi:hypothetical protein